MSKNRIAQMLRASLESVDEEMVEGEVGVPDEDMAVTDPEYAEAENVEGSMSEAAEAEAEVEETETAVDELQEAADGLESIALSLESALESGGLTPQSAEFLNHAVKSFTKRVGMTQEVTASLEAYGGATTRIQATRISLEGIKETWNKFVAAIKAMWERFKAAVVRFFKHIFDGATRLRVKAQRLYKAAKAAKGEPTEKTVTIKASLVSKLTVDGKEINDPINKVKDVIKASNKLTDEQSSDTTDLIVLIDKAVVEPNKENLDKLEEHLKKNDTRISMAFPHSKKDSAGNEYSTEVLPGDVKFTIYSKDGKLSSKKVSVPSKKAEDLKIGTLSLESIKRMANGVIEFVKEFDKFKNSMDTLTSTTSKLMKDSIKESKAASSEKEGMDYGRLRKLTNVATGNVMTISRTMSSVGAYGVTTSGNVLQVAAISLAKYKKAA